ncbi:gamma-glutamyltranspeptidase 3-like protein [Trifolium pratense]|uniref:Gamma-glutamyltranspeptidase 3-like protein n=1 Tax=Trifolium pratense TaxID=57577 RepID=A0A2K3M568_TRIPR|nr:gamma-glutamyltranspeptidase 3-like protein [Trifolium pratense]
MLTEEYSALFQKKLPQKCKDPGSITVPCSIGGVEVGQALCDLGASVNLMSLSIMRKLNCGEVKPTRMTLILANRTKIVACSNTLLDPFELMFNKLSIHLEICTVTLCTRFTTPIVVVGLALRGDINFEILEGAERYNEGKIANERNVIKSEVGVVAADDARCSAVGVYAVLKLGGHAVNATVASALCAGVVFQASSGLGCGSFMAVKSSSCLL